MADTDPLNILAEIVFASANDVLAGLQTWEEHEAYLMLPKWFDGDDISVWDIIKAAIAAERGEGL